MNDETLARIAALMTDAAVGLGSWPSVGAAVREALDCTKVSLLHGPSDGAGLVDLVDDGTDPDGERAAALHRPHDPSLPVSVAIAAGRLERRPVADLFELVPETEFRRSAYYADYARRAGLYHRLGFSAVRGGGRMAPFRVHRPEHAPPFNEADRAALLRIKPYLKHAVALRRRLQVGAEAAGAGLAALDARPEAMLATTGEGRVVYANRAAEALLRAPDGPLRLVRDGPGPAACEPPAVAARLGADAGALAALLAAAAAGRPGGLRRLGGGELDAGSMAAVTPLPARLLDADRPPGAVAGLALLVLTDLRRRPEPDAAALAQAFGLSAAEAAVAALLAAGATAEAVSAARRTSPETVRTQIRAVLRKTGAAGLRDFERIAALVGRL